jgi:multidrug efflux system membrane fusion protein
MLPPSVHTLLARRPGGPPSAADRTGPGARLLRRLAPCLLPLLVLATGCGGEDGKASAPGGATAPVPVVVATVRSEDVPVRINVIGNVEAYSTVAVKSQVEGQLAQVHFQEGQEVKAGDLLFTVDPRPFEAALRQAEAALAHDQAEASNATVEAGRLKRLLAQGFVSHDEVDQALTRAAALAATVDADRAAVETAKLNLQYCTIRSPIDGRIGQILAHQGNVVKENDTTLAVINQIRPIRVAFSAPERDLGRIRERAASDPLTVEARVPGTGATAQGTLSFIDNAVDTRTGTVLLKGEFPNRDEVLWPGQFVDVALTLAVEKGAIVAPAEALQTGQEGSYVFVVKPDLTAEVRPVVSGRAFDSSIVIEKGLAAGERVVTDGQIRLANGSKVQVRDATVATATAE